MLKKVYMSKRKAKNLMTNSNLFDKKGVLVSSTTYYQRNRDVMLNRAKEYYKNDKERLRKQARDKYRNMSEEKKQKLKEYQKNYCEAKKIIRYTGKINNEIICVIIIIIIIIIVIKTMF